MIKIEDINKKKKLRREIIIFCFIFLSLMIATVSMTFYTLKYETNDLFQGIVYGLLGTIIISCLAVSIALRFRHVYSKEIEEIARQNSDKRTTRQELIKATAELFNLQEKIKMPNSKVVIIMISIHKLNDISALYNYETKDDVVKEFQSRLESLLGKNDILALMEENILAFLFISDMKNTDFKIKALQKKLKEPYTILNNNDKTEIILQAKIGYNIQRKESWHNSDTFVNKAQIALESALISDADIPIIYKESLTDNMKQIHNAEFKLRSAINSKDFEVAYQPKVDPRLFTVVGAEALFRWKGMPQGFNIGSIIELAEMKGLIDDLTKVIFEKVFIDIRRWEKQGRKYKIAVNLSTKTLNDPSFVRWLKNLMEMNNVNPAMVEIEITETSLIENIKKAIESINALKELGCSIAIDDFGTGHSSFNYLVDIPADVIKIDRSFIIPLAYENSDKQRAVVSSIIHLAHKMNCKVVAEGVEEPAQLKILQDEGCDMIQGYLYSKPLKPEDFDLFSI